MLLGMLLGVLFYRPIFNTFLNDANVKEWVKTGEGLQKIEINKTREKAMLEDNVALNIVKTITKWEKNEVSFLEQTVDTIVADVNKDSLTVAAVYPPLSQLGNQVEKEKAAIKSKYYDVTLSTSLKWKFIFLIWVMIVFVTMVYGPIAAFLVELFPTKIRYTSMSLPYHIGNGVFGGLVPFRVFGGLVPFIATLLASTFSNDPLVGLWYPIGIAALCFIIGAVYLNSKVVEN